MRKSVIALLTGAGALLLVSAGNAGDFYTASEYVNSDTPLVQPVRYRIHSANRVIIRNSYNYAPRERFIEHRRYRDWDGSRTSIGIYAPGGGLPRDQVQP